MNKIKIFKIIGLLGAVLTGVYTISTGDVVTGVGVIAAAFSSSTALGKSEADES